MSRARSGSSIDAPKSEPLAPEQLDALLEVLNAVRAEGSHSRPGIIDSTGLTRAVVASRVAELLRRGLLFEGTLGPSSGGRAPRQLEFSANAGHVLAADLGATSIDVAVSDLSGQILRHIAKDADIADGSAAILGQVDEMFAQLLAETHDVPGELWGIGVGVPGPVDFGTGCVVAPPIMPGWGEFPIRERFAERYEVPVWVDNDVNVMALGEFRAGAARGHGAVVFVKLGTGIGAGIMVDGRLHRGAHGSAGDVGHTRVSHDPSVVCRCGKIGCLEALAGGAALARTATDLAQAGSSPILAERMGQQGGRLQASDVSWAASHGDAASAQLILEAGHLVGEMLSTVVHFFNPSLIVIGGGVSNAGDQLLAAIRESVYGLSLPLATRDLQVRRASLGGRSGVVGVVTMVLDELFSRDCFARWVENGSPSGHPELAVSAS